MPMKIKKLTEILITIMILYTNQIFFASPYNHFVQWPAKNTSVTGGWLQTTWHQEAPYNQFCPFDSAYGRRSLSGCMATAVAQIVNYHEFINSPVLDANDQYITRDSEIRIDQDSSRFDFPSFHHLNNYLKTIKASYHSGSALKNDEIASLGFVCGILLKTNYSSFLSGISHDISSDIFDRLGYESAFTEESESDFWRTLKQNMINGYPAILVLPDHAVVADGYNTKDEYHLNFGWGDENPVNIKSAWFDLDPAINPALWVNTEYSIVQIAPKDMNQMLDLSTNWAIKTDVFNTWSQPVAFEMSNCSNALIEIDYVLLPSSFSASWDDVAYSDSLSGILIDAGQSKTIYVRYKPTQMDTVSGDGFIAYNHQKSVRLIEITGLMDPLNGTIIATEEVSGEWSESESPYHVLNNISVSPNSRLKIEEGVRIIFWYQSRLYVGPDAQLIARGSETDSIQWMPINQEQGWGGLVVERSGSDDTLAYCHIAYAKGNTFGGALWVIDSESVIHRCHLQYNSAEFGGGMYVWGGHPQIHNTIISHNQASYGGGICTEMNASLDLVNVTLTNNKAQTGGGIHLSLSNTMKINNSILWHNQAEYGKTFSFSKNDKINIAYSDIENKVENWQYAHDGLGGSIDYGEGVISVDPAFLNELYYLSDSSECIDKGDPAPEYYDIENEDAQGFALFPAKGGLRNDMGAYGGGSLSYRSVVEHQNSVTEAFFLLQNYPNPFNHATRISYQVHKKNHVIIRIVDVLGKELEVLVDTIQPCGAYSIDWNGEAYASGIYLAEYIAGPIKQTHKMMLMR